MTVLGLKNQCKLKSVLPHLGSPFYSIRVVPALPRLAVHIASPNKYILHNLYANSFLNRILFFFLISSSSAVNTSELNNLASVSSIQLYAGQSTECDLTLVNTSNVLVESFDLEITHTTRSSNCQVFNVRLEIFCYFQISTYFVGCFPILEYCHLSFISYFFVFNSVDNLKDQLPWQCGAAVSVTVYVQGASDFIMPTVNDCNTNIHQTDDSNSLPSLSGMRFVMNVKD